MATITFEGFMGATPSWTSLGANTLVFSGSATDLTVPITVASWQDGTHAGNGDPGTDQCGANVKYIDSTHMSVDGAASEVVNDANITTDECTLRLHFNHASAVAVSGARLFCYDGTTDATPGVGMEVQAFERTASVAAWTEINDESAGVGGDNAGERLDLANSASAVDHYWYVCLSASPESVGAKASFDFKLALTYS
jgi:hypothetical protein